MKRLIVGAGNLIAAIRKHKSKVQSINDHTHVLAASCIYHAAKHGQASAGALLLETHQSTSLIKWLNERGVTVRFNRKAKEYRSFINKSTITVARDMLAKGDEAFENWVLAIPFYKMDEDNAKAFYGINFLDELMKVYNRALKIRAGEGKYADKAKHPSNNFDAMDAFASFIKGRVKNAL